MRYHNYISIVYVFIIFENVNSGLFLQIKQLKLLENIHGFLISHSAFRNKGYKFKDRRAFGHGILSGVEVFFGNLTSEYLDIDHRIPGFSVSITYINLLCNGDVKVGNFAMSMFLFRI